MKIGDLRAGVTTAANLEHAGDRLAVAVTDVVLCRPLVAIEVCMQPMYKTIKVEVEPVDITLYHDFLVAVTSVFARLTAAVQNKTPALPLPETEPTSPTSPNSAAPQVLPIVVREPFLQDVLYIPAIFPL